MVFRRFFVVALAFVIAGAVTVTAQTYTPDSSNRVTINLGATAWKLIKSDPVGAQDPNYNDGAGLDIGIPHSMAEDQTFVNNTSGGGNLPGGPYWYRKKFTLDSKYSGKKVFLECEGVHLGCQVYVNGTMLQTTSTINPNATHVIGFTGFTNDVTNLMKFDGTNNVIAIRVAMNAAWFGDPGFSTVFRFGQGSGGPFRPVWLIMTDKIHIPTNEYSGTRQWGTYVATTNVATDGSQATVRMLTNVLNDGAAAQSVTLTTKIVDPSNNSVISSQDATHSIDAGSSYVFDQTATINNPHLWYPNNSPYGTPYMHKVYHIVKVGTTVVDLAQSPLGIRTITWDKDYPYINGKKQCLYGASSRYDYPALGTAVPPALEWRDAKMMAEVGGNLWRPGHSTCSSAFVEACDAFGIMIVQPSGEGEGSFSTTAIDQNTSKRPLKKEIHRDMIIRDRSHPSILAWEASNGDMDSLYADTLRTLSKTWDSLAPREIALRGKPYTKGQFDLHGCTLTGCDAQQKPLGNNINFPWWGSEYWGRHSSRFAYDYQVVFCAEFLRDWAAGIKNHCFGMAQWYFMETPGETGPYEEGIASNNARSFGSSMTDFNRIPKYLYYQYGVCWIPYAIQPRIAIANHWNRTGTVRVDVWSNCPQVRLSVNGTVIGTKAPNGQLGATGGINDVTNTTTQLPFQCVFTGVAWQSGILKAEGLDAGGNVVCTDQKVTAGAPHHIVLSQEQNTVKPNGETFNVTANGTDVALIKATIVDANGVWCPTATGNITWSVAGPATYRGGSDQFVTNGQGYGYHAALDPELAIEGGMAMVAVRAQFATQTVTVTANVNGLPQPTANTTFNILPVTQSVVVANPAQPNALSGAAIGTRIYTAGRLVKYCLTGISDVAVDLRNAHGQVVSRIPASRQSAGWHSISFSPRQESGIRASGVYFVSIIVNGEPCAAKRIVLTR
jgi:beta-galactosidase